MENGPKVDTRLMYVEIIPKSFETWPTWSIAQALKLSIFILYKSRRRIFPGVDCCHRNESSYVIQHWTTLQYYRNMLTTGLTNKLTGGTFGSHLINRSCRKQTTDKQTVHKIVLQLKTNLSFQSTDSKCNKTLYPMLKMQWNSLCKCCYLSLHIARI